MVRYQTNRQAQLLLLKKNLPKRKKKENDRLINKAYLQTNKQKYQYITYFKPKQAYNQQIS